jgi:hypothetical protein
VAEHVLDDLDVDAGGEGGGGGAVPQVVQPDGWQSGEVGEQFEGAVTVAGCRRGW